MAGVQGSALAIAVSNAGGLGSLPCALLSPEQHARRADRHPRRDHAAGERQLLLPSGRRNPMPARETVVARGAIRPFYDELQPRCRRRFPKRRRGGRSTTRRSTCSPTFRPAVVSFHFGLPEPRLLAARQGLGRAGPVLGDHRRRGALARGSRRRRGHRAGPRGGRPPRHVPDRRPHHPARHARAACRSVLRGGRRAGDRRRRHRRRRGRAAGAGARRRRPRRSARRTCSARRRPPAALHRAGAEERGGAPHRADQPLHRPAGARHRQPLHARARADQPLRRRRSRWRPPRSRRCVPPPRRPAAATSRRCGPGRTPAAAARFRPPS